MNTGAIEDLANLGLNYWITIDDNTQWPTPNQFVIRFYPQPVEAPVDPEICDDTIDNDGDGAIDCLDSDGAVDCADSDCEGIAGCGTEGRLDTCSDGFDNDGDGEIDCLDSGCARNKSCR